MADAEGPGSLAERWGPPGPLAEPLLAGWGALADALSIADEPGERQRFREAKCFAAAVAWALLQLPSTAPRAPVGRPVVVWLVGARSLMEGQLVQDGEWRLLADIFPDLQWELVLVGPEMDADTDAVPADGADGRVQARSVRLKGHDYARQKPPRPDFAVCFNSGIGTLSIALVKHWLETVEELLLLDVPVLFTCFSQKEQKGEDFIIGQLYKARVLAGFRENPLRPLPEDKPVGYRKKETVPAAVDAVEKDSDQRICSTFAWWVQGSELSPEELRAVSSTSGPEALRQLTANFALQGAWRGWLEALRGGTKEVGRIALESFAAATENPVIAKAFTKMAKQVIEAVVIYTRKHGVHPDARPCIERIMFAKVRALLGEDVADADILETVRQTVDEEHGKLLPRQEG